MSQFNITNIVLDFFQGKKDGFFLESGSSHPTDQSCTYELELHGWNGLLIEPRIEHNEQYKAFRPKSIVENYALVGKDFTDTFIESFKSPHSGHMYSIGNIHKEIQPGAAELVIWPTSTLEKLLKKHKINKIDFFSLDVEGYEHEVLNGIDFNEVEFGMILIETHDYTWNGRNFDFSYLEKYGYIFHKNPNHNHQLWIKKNTSI
jgi:FkbM family methyltransferase